MSPTSPPPEGRHVVIGTAGHVDHGKTALVQALTGIDTDRWEEEKRRGITIDLGFAHFRLDDETQASVVDVPGHEDFVRNMVAGATGIDLALLVVAADEGVMPQTVEHLAILRYLGIDAGVVAVTKTDLVEPDWLELVLEDIADRIGAGGGEGYGIVWEPPVPVSAKTGAGLDALRNALSAAARRASAGDERDLFRLPVDRVFSVAGAGTVVTGTAWAGTVSVGDDVRVLPGGAKGRVRNVEVHGRSAAAALPGRRTALALAGVDRADVGRGSWVVKDGTWRATTRIDVAVSLLPAVRPLTQRSRIRLHLGTAEVMARVTPAEGEIGPGESGVVRLRLEAPVVSRWGDRGVLRSYSPVTTVGGCVVVDPWPDHRPRRPSPDPARSSPEPAHRIVAFAEAARSRGLPVDALPVRLGVFPVSVDVALGSVDAARVMLLGDHVVSSEVAARARDAARSAVRRFHQAEPLKPGLPLEAFRRAAGGGFLADHARAALEADGEVVVERGAVRLAEHTAELSGAHVGYGEVVRRALDDAGPKGVVAADLDGSVPADAMVDVAEFFVRQNTAVRVGGDRYYNPGALQDVASKTVEHLRQAGSASPAEFRDLLGLSRKFLIPLLEWLDGQGVTVRDGDVRRLGPKAETTQRS